MTDSDLIITKITTGRRNRKHILTYRTDRLNRQRENGNPGRIVHRELHIIQEIRKRKHLRLLLSVSLLVYAANFYRSYLII